MKMFFCAWITLLFAFASSAQSGPTEWVWGKDSSQGGNPNYILVDDLDDWYEFWGQGKRNDDNPGTSDSTQQNKTVLVLTRNLRHNNTTKYNGDDCDGSGDVNCAVFHARPGCDPDGCSGAGGTEWTGFNLDIDCQGHGFIYEAQDGGKAGPDTNEYGILRFDGKNGFGKDPVGLEELAQKPLVRIRNCSFHNVTNSTLKQSALLVANNNNVEFDHILDYTFIHAEDDALTNGTSSIRFVSDLGGLWLTRFAYNQLWKGIGHDFGSYNYNWNIANTILCSQKDNNGKDIGIRWEGQGGGEGRGQVVSNNNQYAGCQSYSAYLRNTDLFETTAIYDGGGASDLDTPYIVVGVTADATASPTLYSSVKSTNAQFMISNNLDSSRWIFDLMASSGIDLEGTIQFNGATPATCVDGSFSSDSFISSDGFLLDSSTHASADIAGSINIKLQSLVVAQTGEICGPAMNVPANYMTVGAKAACAADANGCRGKIDLPGIGQYQIVNDAYQALPGTFQILGAGPTGAENGDELCDDGVDGTATDITDPGGISSGLTCYKVTNASTGADVVCASGTFAASTPYKVDCK